MTIPARLDDDLSGLRLRRNLRLDGPIARGSFGSVYRARQLDVDRDVAVKLLHAGFEPDDEAGRLFRDEIRAIGTIDHRNVVRVYDADLTPDGRLYFVMELLRGRTLHQLAEGGPLPLPRALELITQLLDGLAAVHRAGHIHADVKPSNAIVVPDGDGERVVLIDFGLSRLHCSEQHVEAVGGTRAYMAPEQLAAWEVEPRSDVFSAALVMLRLVTGWQRRDDNDEPPLDEIHDPAVRFALERATARAPADRPPAADLARALRGEPPNERAPPEPRPPFLPLTPMATHDRGRLHGREADVIRLFGTLDPARPVILAAPSGTGKTSLLCAGLVPYLNGRGIEAIYLACWPGETAQLPHAIWAGAPTASVALAARQAAGGRRLVLILDQAESLVRDTADGQLLLGELLDRRSEAAEIAILLAVREDFVARLVAANGTLSGGVPQVRLRPLDREGGRTALLAPLTEHGVALAPELLQVVLDDLVRAGRDLGAMFGWGAEPTVYPPHLQLIGEALWSSRGPREATLTIAHYQRIGGLEAVLMEHLDRKLAALSEPDRAIARDLFLSLVASSQTRAVRSEAELLDVLGGRHRTEAVHRVLGLLEQARLVLRRAAADGVTWELLHDSLVPHIEAWLDVHDAERQRAAEMIRFHLLQSRSRAEAPALLSMRQLRRLARFPGLVEDLELEWARRPAAVWTPRSLIARSRKALRLRRGVTVVGALGVLAAAGLLLVRWSQSAHEAYLRERDLGRIELSLTVFDWEDRGDGEWAPVPVDPGSIPDLQWSLHDPALDDRDSPGPLVPPDRVARGQVAIVERGRVETSIDVRSGAAFLAISGRGAPGETCGPSIIPVVNLPGYATRAQRPPRLEIYVPSCKASAFDTVEIPPGTFYYGGGGDPPTSFPADSVPREEEVSLGRYRIDRVEVTNSAFQIFADMGIAKGPDAVRVHDIVPPAYPDLLAVAGGPAYPRTDLDWFDARSYCRFMGKDLPTSRQWQKALRGGLILPDGKANPYPRRNLPWGPPIHPPPAVIAHVRLCEDSTPPCAPSPVAARDRPTGDRSPYGVDDLAGAVQEWIADAEQGSEQLPFSRRTRLTRGGNWATTMPEKLVDYMAIENPRSPRKRAYHLGVRCVQSR